jgi:general secretion pathway protein A
MFLNFFAMSSHPFSERTPASELINDHRMKEGLARLDYFSREGAIALITGHTGVGKSSLIRIFQNSVSRTRFNLIHLQLSHIGAAGLLKLICRSLGESPKLDKQSNYQQIFDSVQNSDLITIFIIDEAQLLDSDSLTVLRLLVCSQDSDKLKIVLCGQDRLRDQLKQSRQHDLVHRLSMNYNIPALTVDQTIDYLDRQMIRVGSNEAVFETEAKKAIHEYSTGLPRQINNLATACLINATASNSQKITTQMVNLVTQELTVL